MLKSRGVAKNIVRRCVPVVTAFVAAVNLALASPASVLAATDLSTYVVQADGLNFSDFTFSLCYTDSDGAVTVLSSTSAPSSDGSFSLDSLTASQFTKLYRASTRYLRFSTSVSYTAGTSEQNRALAVGMGLSLSTPTDMQMIFSRYNPTPILADTTFLSSQGHSSVAFDFVRSASVGTASSTIFTGYIYFTFSATDYVNEFRVYPTLYGSTFLYTPGSGSGDCSDCSEKLDTLSSDMSSYYQDLYDTQSLYYDDIMSSLSNTKTVVSSQASSIKSAQTSYYTALKQAISDLDTSTSQAISDQTSQITDNMDTMRDDLEYGYYNSDGDNAAADLSDATNTYQNSETSLFTSSKTGMDSFETADLASVGTVVTGMSFVTSIMTSIYNSMGGSSGGGAHVVLSVLFTVVLLTMIIGLAKRYQSSGGVRRGDRK